MSKGFDSTIFSGLINFDSAHINSINLSIDSFANDISFVQTVVFQNPNFSHSIFRGNVNFCNFSLNFGHIDFSYAKFYKTIYFRNLTLYGDNADFVFDNAILPDTLDFSYNPRIRNEVDLTTANISQFINSKEGFHYIFIFHSDISKFHFNYQNFKLLFIDPLTHYSLSQEDRNFLYESLLKNFKDRGQLLDYKLLDIEYHQYQWHSKSILYRWTGKIVELLDNYGYDNERVFTWIFILLVIFTIINSFFLNKLTKNIYKLERIDIIYSPKSLKERGINFWYSLVYTTHVFFSPTIKLDNLNYKRIIGTCYITFMRLMGLTLGGFAIHTIIA